MNTNPKTFTIFPVAGPLDMTSSPDGVPFGGWRYAENVETNPQDRKLKRMTGYQRMLPEDDYENSDLHYRNGLARQHLTFGFEARTPAGFTKLFVGTQNQLFARSNSDSSWKTIATGKGGDASLEGCSEIMFSAANVNSTVIFTNNFDEPFYHVIDQPANADGSFTQPIPDFQTLNITRAGFIYAWNNLMLVGDLVMDGVRQSNVILWSDLKKPLSFVPNAAASLAGKKTLAYGEIVLNAAPIADALLIFTNMGIWEVRVSSDADALGNPVVLTFSKRYTSDMSGSRCLKFKRSLVATGDDFYYAGEDGIYKYNFYQPRPQIEEWSRRAASHLFIDGTINKARCSVHCAGYDTAKKAYWFSYSRAGDNCNSETLVMNVETHFSAVVKEGFSFFLNYNPRRMLSLRQWMADNCICTVAEMPARDACQTMEQPACVDPVPTDYTSTGTKTLHSYSTEDWTATPGATSLRTKLAGIMAQDTCGSEYTGGNCATGTLFIFGSVLDRTIKQASNVFYRERCLTFAKCATYASQGYLSILRSGPITLEAPVTDKTMMRFCIEAEPDVALVPGRVSLRIGVANTCIDPNQQVCPILWSTHFDPLTQEPFVLACFAEKTVEQYQANNERPDGSYEWLMFQTGRVFYFELTIHNPDSTPTDTGAGTGISRIEFDMKLECQ